MLKMQTLFVALLALLAVAQAGDPYSKACYRSLGQLCFMDCDRGDLAVNAAACSNPSGLDHAKYMRMAVAVARANHKFFGAVIVDRRDGSVAATGCNTGTNHFTIGHGEINAIINFTNIFPNIVKPFSNYTLYTTGESCPMCAAAIHYSGFSEVVYGSSIRELIHYGYNQLNIYHHEVIGSDVRPKSKECIIGGILANETMSLFNPYPNTPIPQPSITSQCTDDAQEHPPPFDFDNDGLIFQGSSGGSTPDDDGDPNDRDPSDDDDDDDDDDHHAPTLLGCYTDTATRDLSVSEWDNSQMTVEKCVAFCNSLSTTYAGVQFSTQCFCGNSFGAYGESNNCNMNCGGDANENCGGTWANSVYSLSH